MQMKKLAGFSVLTLFLATAPGCRFGNYADTPQPLPDPAGSAGTISKVQLFYAQPSSLATAVFYTDSTPTGENDSTPLSAIPASTLSVFSDPFYYATMVNPTDSPLFIGIDGTSHITTAVDASGNINYDTPDADSVQQLLQTTAGNPDCLTQVQPSQVGSLNYSNPGTIQFSDGTNATVYGHVVLDYKVTTVIQAQTPGACDADLQFLAQCYLVGTGCTTAELTQAQNLFDLYVKQAGILDMNNVTKINALVYLVHFE